MILSLITGIRVFVDFLDDPYLTPEVLKIEGQGTIKYYFYIIMNFLFRYFATQSNNIIGVSAIGLSEDSMLPEIYSKRYSMQPDKMIIVPNGSDLSTTHQKSKRENNKHLGIIYVSRMGPAREVDVLIENLKKIEGIKFELILIGETVTKCDKQWLHELISGHKWISYKGQLPHNEVLHWIDKSDVCIFMASKGVTNYRYTHPIKVLEYLAMGKPVISPRFEGIMEIIQDGYNGFLFDPNHPEELIDIITKNVVPFINREFSKNALNSVKDFDWNDINKKFISRFQGILSKK